MMAKLHRRPAVGWLVPAALVALLAGCTLRERPAGKPLEVPALERLAPASYPDFSDDMDYDGLDHGIQRSLAYLSRVPASRTFTFGRERYSVAHMVRSLELFREAIGAAPPPDALVRWLRSHCAVYRAVGGKESGSVLFTGYFEPMLSGRLTPKGAYRFPVYAKPDDLVQVDLAPFSPKFEGESIIGRIEDGRLIPYHDRQAITGGSVLEGQARVLAWLQDPVDLFFLQIQGSGKIVLEDGRLLNVHYHTTNGHPYRSIGKHLIEQGAIARERMSMQAIRGYLKAHPEAVDAVLNTNPSYVFFKTETDGPLGSLGVKLTPGRSIATDRRLFPQSALAFARTRQPLIDADGTIREWTGLNRFVLNQDTGGAIRGAGRADFFWGSGPYAELAAGHLQHPGELYFIVLKPDAEPLEKALRPGRSQPDDPLAPGLPLTPPAENGYKVSLP